MCFNFGQSDDLCTFDLSQKLQVPTDPEELLGLPEDVDGSLTLGTEEDSVFFVCLNDLVVRFCLAARTVSISSSEESVYPRDCSALYDLCLVDFGLEEAPEIMSSSFASLASVSSQHKYVSRQSRYRCELLKRI